MKNKINLLIAVIIGFLILNAYSVKAAESKYINEEGKSVKCSSKYPKLAHITENDFKIEVVERPSSTYEFFLNPQDIVKDIPVTISCYDITNGKTLVNQNTLVGHRGGFYLKTEKGRIYECEAIAKISYEIKNSNGEPILDATGNKQECSAAFSQTISFEENFGDEENIGIKNCQDLITSTNIDNNTSTINCNVTHSDTFNKEFCEAKKNSTAIDFGSKNFKDYNPNFNADADKKAAKGEASDQSFKCDVRVKSSSKTDYVNKKYLFGYGNKIENAGYYKYHYDDPNKDYIDSRAVTCNIRCEEAVTVEYEAPIASKAGMCFSYKVKVTSRVSCGMVEEPRKPDIFTGYCEPVPRCFHGSREYSQGGPSDDFDACIKKCDGGKYTQKCSKKCYKQVYGTALLEKSSQKGQKNATVKKMDLSECLRTEKPQFTCYYVRGENDKINWVCPQGFDCNRPDIYEGRWYNTHWAGFGGKGNYSLCSGHNDGIYRRKLGNGFCTDTCSWYAPMPGKPGAICATPYLNPGLAEWDNYNNMQIYKQAVNSCKAKASCTTTTTYFRISAGYSNYSDNTYTEINFPYSEINGKEKDRLASGKNRIFDNTGLSNTTLIIGKTAEERAKSGCYAPIDEVKREDLYQAEWTFPGTWINNKTGEISYRKKDSGWSEMKKSFCTPLNAKNVNQKWWNWFMKETISGKSTSIETDQYKKECAPYESSSSITKVSTVSSSDIEKWNINAITTDFGYFKWGIHIQCFYALNTNPAMIKTSTSSKEVEKCCPAGGCKDTNSPQGSYRIRSVDLNNLFPSPDGKETPVNETGRAPGFNWSEYATNTQNNPTYQSNPQRYLMDIQKLGNGVYDDQYLDYYFELDKEDLKNLQGENYGSFTGKTTKRKNGITTYYSTEIRNLKNKQNKTPEEKPATECNNLQNWHSSTCATS